MRNTNFIYKKAFVYSRPILFSRQSKSFKEKIYVKSQHMLNIEEGINIFWNCPFDKGRLKNFVAWFLMNYGEQKTIELLEQLKNVGFGYATKAGISLGIDDLKIPPQKIDLLFQAESSVAKGNEQYKKGKITGVERLQRLIDVWNQTSEFLKQEVVKFFEKTDLFNPVYMMAFSGARGNLSQVRQLVGMRGLMSDPQGNIIDFPIQSNFREGLTLTEYIISTYGARKGIVDTALRTATAGYLTRRLVDVAQHVMISQFDCGTTRGIFLFDMKDGSKTIYSFQNRLIGRVLARDIFDLNSTSLHASKKIASKNQEVSSTLASAIAKITKKAFVRSPLTCETKQLVCQLCYGWSLANNRLVSLGEAVGVIAAQSIGEPGTQLTMRTFHTGGVFSGGSTNQILAPFDGSVEYLDAIPGSCVRIPQGEIAFLTKAPGSFFLLEKNDRKKKTELHTVPGYAILFFKNKQKFLEKQMIAQFSNAAQQGGRGKAEQTVYTNLEGQVSLYQIDLVEQQHDKLLEDVVWRAIDWSKIWILSGKNYVDPLGLNPFPLKGDFMNKNSVFQKIYWYSLNSGSIDLTFSKNISSKTLSFLTTKKRFFPTQLTKTNNSLEKKKYLLQKSPKNFYHSMENKSSVFWSHKQMNLKFSAKSVKNMFFTSKVFSKKEKKPFKKINFYRKSVLFSKRNSKKGSLILLTQTSSNVSFYPYKTNIRSFLLRKIHRLGFVSNKVFVVKSKNLKNINPRLKRKFIKKRRWDSFKTKSLHLLTNPFRIESSIPNFFQKKVGKKKRFLKFGFSFPKVFSQTKVSFNKRKKFRNFSIQKKIRTKFNFNLRSTVLKKPYFSNKNIFLFPHCQSKKENFLQNVPSFLIKQSLLNLPVQKITFKNFGYVFSIKRNLKSKPQICFDKSDKIFSFFPLMKKEIFSLNNFAINDPGKNVQSLSLGNTLHWSPFPNTAFRWFPVESQTDTSGVFIWSKPFFSTIFQQNNLRKTKQILNEKSQELCFQNSFFINKKRLSFREGSLKKFSKKEILFSNINLFKSAFSLNKKQKNTKVTKRSFRSTINSKNSKKRKFCFYEKEFHFQFEKRQKSLQYRYLSIKNRVKTFITKKQQHKKTFLRFSKFSTSTQDFYFLPQQNFKFQIWENQNKTLLLDKISSKSEIFLTNRQGHKKSLKIQISGFNRIYKKHTKNQRIVKANKIVSSKKKQKTKVQKKFLFSCFSSHVLNRSNLTKKKKYFFIPNKKNFVSTFYKKIKKSNSILLLSIRNQMFKNLKTKLFLKSKNQNIKNLNKHLDTSLITKLKNQSLFFSSLPIKHVKTPFLSNKKEMTFSRKKLKLVKKSLLNHPQIQGVIKPGWIYFLLDSKTNNSYNVHLDLIPKENWFHMNSNSTSNLNSNFIENLNVILKSNSNSKINQTSLKRFFYIKNLHKKFRKPGKKIFPDLCFEQHTIFIENVFVDEKTSFPTTGNFSQIFQNKKTRFFKNSNQKTQNLFKSSSKKKKIALLLRPVQYKLLQNAQIYKTQLYQSHMNLQEKNISVDFYCNYHSKLLNQQNCQKKILSNFPAIDFEIQQNLPVSFFETTKRKKKTCKKEKKKNKGLILSTRKNQRIVSELKAFYSSRPNAFFSLLLKNSKPLGLNFAFQVPIFRLNSLFQNFNRSFKNSYSNFSLKNQLLSFDNKERNLLYKLLEKNQFRVKIIQLKKEVENSKKFSFTVGLKLDKSKDLTKNTTIKNNILNLLLNKQIFSFKEKNISYSFLFLSPLILEWSLGRKEAYLLNQKFGISSFLRQNVENKILFANAPKSSISKNKIKNKKIFSDVPYNKKHKKNGFFSYPKITNSFFLYKANSIQADQIFATTNVCSPFEGELLTNISNSTEWWNEFGDTLITNQTKKVQNYVFLTKKDIFSVLFFSSNFNPKNSQLNFKPDVSSFNKIFTQKFKSKKQQNQKILFENYFNSFQFLSILNKENQFTKNLYKIDSFSTKYQNKIYQLKGLSLGKPAEQNIFPYELGNYLVKGDTIFGNKKMNKTGQILHFNLKKVTLRYAQPFLISPKGMLHVNQGDFIHRNAPILTLPFETLTTGDIVQGIPKVEQYLEARTTQNGRFFLYSLPVLLKAIFQRYHAKLPLEQAVAQSFLKIQQILVDGVQRVYRSQGVSIAEKHLEVIVKQMTSKVQIIHGGQTGFFPGELVDLEIVESVNKFLMVKIRYEPVVLGITRASLEVESFLSAASFQQTTKILANASLSKKKDYLKGLKENLLVGNLIPAGTGFMNSFKRKEPI